MLGIGLGACADRISWRGGRDSNLWHLASQPGNAAQAHCNGDIRVLCLPLGVHNDLRKATVFESLKPKPEAQPAQAPQNPKPKTLAFRLKPMDITATFPSGLHFLVTGAAIEHRAHHVPDFRERLGGFEFACIHHLCDTVYNSKTNQKA